MVKLALALLLALPLAARAQTDPPEIVTGPGEVVFEQVPRTDRVIRYEFRPSGGLLVTGEPIVRYETDVLHYQYQPMKSYIRLRVRGCTAPKGMSWDDCTDWSRYSDPIYIPEPGSPLLLGAGVLGLVVLRRLKR